jgi:hypothetical protein
VFIPRDRKWAPAIAHTWRIFALNKKLNFEFVSSRDPSDLVVSDQQDADIRVSDRFYADLARGKYDFSHHFEKDCLIRTSDDRPDYLSTAFYMMNSLQEHACSDLDEIGRFKYENSYQAAFGNVEQNLVQQCFDNLCADVPRLTRCQSAFRPTRVFLNHDIDSVHGAYKQDGLAALKRGRIDIVSRLLLNAVLMKPDWLNMDRIMKIEDEYDFRSVFYWLVNKGRIDARMTNADYDIDSSRIRRMMARIEQAGWENGLHKSVCSTSIADEIATLGFRPIGQRYHYLRFQVPQCYDELSGAGVRLDASLGFAEAPGFRNSYGQPFTPFDVSADAPYAIVEAPLTFMDYSFFRYQKTSPARALEKMIGLLEANNRNCVVNILWHNSFFGDVKYRGYLEIYKGLLNYLYESGIRSISQREIVEEYTLEVGAEWARAGGKDRE